MNRALNGLDRHQIFEKCTHFLWTCSLSHILLLIRFYTRINVNIIREEKPFCFASCWHFYLIFFSSLLLSLFFWAAVFVVAIRTAFNISQINWMNKWNWNDVALTITAKEDNSICVISIVSMLSILVSGFCV